MADTFGATSMSGGNTTKYKFPSFRQVDDTDPFDVSKQPLFQQAQETAGQQLGGNVAGFDNQANEARDAFKAAMAANAKAKREQLMGFGMRDSGQYIEEGIIGTADQELGQRQQLERQLSMDRQNQMRQQQMAGQQAAGSLLGMQAQQAQSREALGSQERMQERGFQQESKESALDRATSIMMQGTDIDAQTALTELKGKIDRGMLLTTQDFQSTQAGLDRELAKYTAAGDWANAEKITRLKGEIDAQAAAAQRDWATVERIATQSWSTGERIGEQDFQRATQILDQKQQLAIQANDIAATERIEKQREELQLKLQTQDMAQEEKMAYLGAQLEEAKAQNDVGRQKTLMEFQTLQNLNEMKAANGYDVAMANLQSNLETALQNNDHTNAMAMMQAQQRFAAEEAVKDRDIDYARIALEERGIDMAEVEQQYAFLQAEVEAGRADPNAAFDYVSSVMQRNGVKMEQADPNAIYDELDRDFRLSQYQFAQANPEYAEYDEAGKFIDLKDEGSNAFSTFLQKSYYGADGKPVIGGSTDAQGYSIDGKTVLDATGNPLSSEALAQALRNADRPGNTNNEIYQQLAAQSTTISPRITDKRKNLLEVGANQGDVVNVGGRLMVITKGKFMNKDGRNRHEFEIMDVGTGTKKTFSGMASGDESVNNLGSWVTNLGSL